MKGQLNLVRPEQSLENACHPGVVYLQGPMSFDKTAMATTLMLAEHN